MFFHFLTLKSIKQRYFTVFLTILSITLSVCLFLGVERIRNAAKDGFTNTISQTDLIIGAKSGPLQLLLYSVFHLGSPTANIRYSSFEAISKNPAVDWVIPIALGDTHRGFRVVGTNENFYQHYRFRGNQSVQFKQGKMPTELYDVALGADVAQKLNYKVGDKIIISHGLSKSSTLEHDDSPFTVVGILEKTATPIDQSVYVTLEGIEAIHIGWESGMPQEDTADRQKNIKKSDIQISQITAFYLKTKSRIQTLQLQYQIQKMTEEPLMAIIPGVVLQELWKILGHLESILKIMSIFTLVIAGLSILISIYTSLNERRREVAILRSLGVGRSKIGLLLMWESGLLVLLGCVFGVGLLYGFLYFARPLLEQNFSLYFPIEGLSLFELISLAVIILFGFLIGLIPAWKAYQNSLHDGLTLKV